MKLHRSKPLVSVMMLTYNQEKYVENAILSVLSQDYENFELVISDDCSTDRTREIIVRLHHKFGSKIKFFFNERNLGITGNSNVALGKCSGDLVAFAYGDDLMLPHKLTKQVDWFVMNKEGVLCGHDVEVFDSNTDAVIYRTNHPGNMGKGAHRVVEGCGLYQTTSIMIKRSAAPIEGFDRRVPHCSDFLFLVRLLADSEGLYGKVDGVFARYRRHESNASSAREVCINDIQRSLNIIREMHPNYIKACNNALFQHVLYQRAIFLLADGNYINSFRSFIKLLIKHPLRLKVYLRIVQIPIVALAVYLSPKLRFVFFPHKRLGL